MKTRYTFTLDHEIIEQVKKKIESFGGKLSGLVNNLLINWLRGEEMKEYDVKEYQKMHGRKSI